MTGKTIILSLLAGFLLLARARADEKTVASTQSVSLEVTAARPAAASIWSNDSLVSTSSVIEQSAANAALLYMKAFLALQWKTEDYEHINTWLETAPDKLPAADVQKFLERNQGVFEHLAMAGKRVRCEWDLPFREVPSVIEIALPEAQSARDVARLLALSARLHIAQGEYDEALADLRSGIKVARDIARAPLLVNGLVGISIGTLMLDQVELLVAAKESPNLYWALGALPDPLIDFGPAYTLEMRLLYAVAPQLREVRTLPADSLRWQELAPVVLRRVNEITLWEIDPKQRDTVLKQSVDDCAPAARQKLLALGHDQKEVDCMSPARAVLLAATESWDRYAGEMERAAQLPYWQALPRLEAIGRRLRDEQKPKLPQLNPATVLLPSVCPVRTAMVKFERRVALLRAIEAVRAYAAEHEGKLPEKLNVLQDLPVPLDPATNEPFTFRQDGSSLVVGYPSLHRAPGREYRLKVVP